MATACLGGFPALISAAMFFSLAFSVGFLISGIFCLHFVQNPLALLESAIDLVQLYLKLLALGNQVLNSQLNCLFVHQQFQFFNDAFARSAGPLAFFTTPSILAQKEAFLPSSFLVLGLGAGGFRLALFLALYSARPLAVIPAPLSVGL